MFTTIMGYLQTVIAASFGWFEQLCDSLDGTGVIVGFLAATMVMIASYRFLLSPIIGGRSIGGLGRGASDGQYPSSNAGRDYGGNAPYFDKNSAGARR